MTRFGVGEILYPVDFSDRCVRTAPAVSAWADALGASVTLLHVMVPRGNVTLDYAGRLYAPIETAEREAATKQLRDFAAEHFSGVAVTTAVRRGEAGAAIEDWSAKRRQAMIMMPTHGHGTFRRFLVGSVTARVLHDVACPVWTTAHREKSRVAVKTPKRILCGVDRVPSAVGLLRWAAALAEHFDATLEIAHVLPAVNEESDNRGERAVRRHWVKQAQEELAPLLEAAGQCRVVLRGGPVPEMLAAVAGEYRADLLVIGRGHARANLGRLRTHSMGIVCKSPCPVLSV